MYYNFIEQFVYEAVQIIENENAAGLEFEDRVDSSKIKNALDKLGIDTVFYFEKRDKQFLISTDWERR